MNLKEETIDIIERNKLFTDDIIFIGSEQSGHSCSWEEFLILANREYYDGFGGTEVAEDLIIVFKDGTTLIREEYDGSEWWNINRPFKMPKNAKPIVNLFCVDWHSSLKDIQSVTS